MRILFLTLAEVVEIHQDSIARYGGSPGIRSQGLLESALAQPAAMFGGEYLHAFPHEMGAAYLFHLVMNHPFVDGNKRIGAMTARVFLLINDVAFDPPEADY